MRTVNLIFDVDVKGDPASGMPAFSRQVRITVDGDCGGHDGEFADHIRQSLCDWFDTPSVTQRQPRSALDKVGELYLNGCMAPFPSGTSDHQTCLTTKRSDM